MHTSRQELLHAITHWPYRLPLLRAINVGERDGDVVASMSRSKLVDNAVSRAKALVRFEDLEAKHWDDAGIVVTSGGSDTSELTTHGDPLFYDRMLAASDPR